MQTRQEDDACMHDFIFSKRNTYSFQKVLFFYFSNFLKFLKNLGCYNLPPLKGISSPRFEEARKIGFENSGFCQLGGLPPLKETFVGSLELFSSG